MGAIMAFAKRRGIAVVEDCAQAAGGFYRDMPIGSIGDLASFSFFPTKNLGAIGDGGIVVTSDGKTATALRALRQYGWDENRQTHGIGLNSRLDEIQAAILSLKLVSLDADNVRRRTLAKRYAHGLAGLPLKLPATRADALHAFHLYVVGCEDREALRKHLGVCGVNAGIHYPQAVHQHDGYAQRVRVAGSLAVTEELTASVLSLPMYPELRDDECDQVIAAIRQYFGDRRNAIQ